MSESDENNRKRYIDNPKDKSKHSCIINGPSHSSDECKVLGVFGSKYSRIRSIKDLGHDIETGKKFNRQQENNNISNHAVDEIIPKENNKVSSEAEAHENIEFKITENDLYQIDNMRIYDKKKKIE